MGWSIKTTKRHEITTVNNIKKKMLHWNAVVLLLIALVACTQALPVWVDAVTGEMLTEKPESPGMWPSMDGHCTETVDAQ